MVCLCCAVNQTQLLATCYHTVRNVLSSRRKSISKIKIYGTIGCAIAQATRRFLRQAPRVRIWLVHVALVVGVW
jgi:hypothetical protein